MHKQPHTEEAKRKISTARTGTHREEKIRFGEGIYSDTGCGLSPKCLECNIPLSRCPLEMEARQWHQGQLNPEVVKRLTAMRVAMGGDICDEGSPLNLRWKKYWADKGGEGEGIQ